jgi:hypothetical protein
MVQQNNVLLIALVLIGGLVAGLIGGAIGSGITGDVTLSNNAAGTGTYRIRPGQKSGGDIVFRKWNGPGANYTTLAKIDSQGDYGFLEFSIGNTVKTQLSGAGFYLNFSEGQNYGSIAIMGDNIIMDKKAGTNIHTKSIISPGSISAFDSINEVSGRINPDYLQFCKTIPRNTSFEVVCITCYPNFETKSLDCR